MIAFFVLVAGLPIFRALLSNSWHYRCRSGSNGPKILSKARTLLSITGVLELLGALRT